MAAAATVADDRQPHSLHAYFLRPGTHCGRIELEVRRLLDGRSFSTRQVLARQDGEIIFQASASFARDEEGLAEQTIAMPGLPDPEALPDREEERAQRYWQAFGVELSMNDGAVEVRLPDPSVVAPGRRPPHQETWLRVRGALPDDRRLRRAMLVYASDRTLLSVARMRYEAGRHRLMAASLDHAIWIHDDSDPSEWHVCQCDSPVTRGGRSIVLGRLFRADGVCVATVAQEGLVRRRP